MIHVILSNILSDRVESMSKTFMWIDIATMEGKL